MHEVRHGLDHGMLYFPDTSECWLGLRTMKEMYTPLGEAIIFVDGDKRRIQFQGSDYSANITAYTFHDRMLDEPFGFSYRVYTNEERTEYELHLVYDVYATLDDLYHQTLLSDRDAPMFTLDVTTIPKQTIFGERPVSHLILRTNGLWPEAISHVEDILYGTADENPRLPSMAEIVDILERYVWLKITDNQDGTWSAEEMNGATDLIAMVSETEFAIDWTSANYIEEQTYTIHSQ